MSAYRHSPFIHMLPHKKTEPIFRTKESIAEKNLSLRAFTKKQALSMIYSVYFIPANQNFAVVFAASAT